MHRSLRSLLSRFPGQQSGLNYWDEILLEATRDHGSQAACVIAAAFAHDVDWHDQPDGDYLFARLRRMADPGLRHPLLAMAGNPAEMRGLEVSLTTTGAEALAGRANFITLNGINEWIGGVHLNAGHGRLWFRHRDTLVLAD